MTDPILSGPTVTRRKACRVAGTAALFGTSALAGCLNDDGGTAEDEGDNGDTNDGTETNDTDAEERENLAIQFAGPQGAAMTIPTRLIRDEGFAEDHGLDLDLEMMPPPAIQQAIAAEEIEAGTFPVIPGARLANEGRNVRLLSPVCHSFNSIIVHEDTDVDDLEDLQNVTLGSMPRTSAPWTHFALLASMEGFDPDDYDYRTGPPATLFGAIQQGDIEAMIGVEPFSSRLLATGEFEEPYVFTARWEELTGYRMPLVEVATYQATIDEKPEAVRALMASMFDAGAHISENPRGVIEEYADELGLETETEIDLVEERIGHIYPGEFDEELRNSGAEVVSRASEEGLVDGDPSETLFVRFDEL